MTADPVIAITRQSLKWRDDPPVAWESGAQDVDGTDEKYSFAAGVLMGLGLLAALFAAANS
jgi:hypothetical protein